MFKIAFQAALLAAAFQAPALANESMPDIRVYHGDLDLADPAGVAALDRRLKRAVKAACPSDHGVRDLSRLQTIALCRAAKRAEIAPLRATALAATEGGTPGLATAR